MPFIIVPVGGGIKGGRPELHQSYADAKEVAEVKAKENPGTVYQIYATVSTVHVPTPSPIWNEERYVPDQLK
jgi:hypothetical protein